MKNLFVNPSESINYCLNLMAKIGEKSLVVRDRKEKFLGILSDGDIRKAILSGVNLNSNISMIYNTKSFFIRKESYNQEYVKNIFIKKRYNLIPVLDNKNKVLDVLFWEKEFEKEKNYSKNDIIVIIIAGGMGKRLEPFSKILPKPLIPINEKSIINHIIDRFLEKSFISFIVTLNYKKNIIKSFLKDYYKSKVNISYTLENEPTGTIGSLRLLNKSKLKKPFYVTNCDIIVKSDYNEIYNWHIKNKCDLTIIASLVSYQIPYGICVINKSGKFNRINEKPSSNHLINTGFYVMSPNCLKYISRKGVFHMTDLIEILKKNKKTIGVFPIAENDWLDVGQWAEYRKSIEKFKD